MSMNNTKLQNPGTRLLVIDIEAITGTLEVLKIRVGRVANNVDILAIVPPAPTPVPTALQLDFWVKVEPPALNIPESLKIRGFLKIRTGNNQISLIYFQMCQTFFHFFRLTVWVQIVP